MARVERDVCLRPRDLEKLRKVVLEFADVLDEYLAGVNGGKQQAQHKQQPASKQSSSNRKPRSKYTFNKAILAVLHSNGCMSQGKVMEALDLGKDEVPAFLDAWKYLTDRSVIVPDESRHCWHVRR